MTRFLKTRARQKGRAPELVPAQGVFEPQAKITMTRDVTGWAHRERRQKYALKSGEVYYVDADTAAEFIVKGYATGELPREVSDDERAEWRSQMTVIRAGG
ncbi:MAG: hypothetical protein ACRD8U_21270 [Pyrinomonadaceae bacterium]